MKAVIMAGGKGSRISSIASDIPKPMIHICGKPILEREILCLKQQGISDFIITVSHMGQVITDYFANGSKFGVNIEYYFEREPLGNAGALFRIKDKLAEDFLLINGDVLFDINLERFARFHRQCGGFATLFTHPNSHPYDSGIIVADECGVVMDWLTKEDIRPQFYKNRVNAGIHIISPKLIDYALGSANLTANGTKVDLDRQLLKPLAATGLMFAYDSPEYVKDMGTPERYNQVEADFRSGLVVARNLKQQQHAIFLDRDGTMNKYVGFLNNIDEFELLPGVVEGIQLINKSGYLAIVVTNQPVIARGEVTIQQLEDIHNKMETLLGEQGAYVDGIYYCPHHPDSGFDGEISKLKITCDCRKPKPGLLLQAAKDFNIDLSQSYMIGDSENDVLAGQAAGCRSVLITDGNLLSAVQQILAEDIYDT